MMRIKYGKPNRNYDIVGYGKRKRFGCTIMPALKYLGYPDWVI
jgi:hypothetical protein